MHRARERALRCDRFDMLDHNNSGDITFVEFREKLLRLPSGMEPEEIDELLQEMALPDALPFSRCMTVADARRKITRWRDQLRRDAAVESRTRATSIGRGHRPRGAKHFSDLLKTK